MQRSVADEICINSWTGVMCSVKTWNGLSAQSESDCKLFMLILHADTATQRTLLQQACI